MDNIRKIGENINNSENFTGSVLYDEMLSIHTSMRVGGPADVFVMPESEESFINALKTVVSSDVPYYVLGGGTNLIFADEGFRGVVLCTSEINKFSVEASENEEEGIILCGAGTPSAEIAEFAAENAISGFSNFAGLPGTAGGACYMNARCYETDFSSVISEVTYVDLSEIKANPELEVANLLKVYHNDGVGWDYKKSPFMGTDWVVLSLKLKGVKGEKSAEELSTLNEFRKQDRLAKGHFKFPSAGSVFKNNHAFGKSSGAIIDEAGLKGSQMGAAQVAPWHGNFIINTGGATAKDVKALVKYVQWTVSEQKGFALEPEIIFVNL